MLAAGKITTASAKHLRKDRKQFEDFIRDAAILALQSGKAGLQVLLHAEQGEYFTSLRHVADAGPGTLPSRCAGHILAIETDLAAAHGLMTNDCTEQACLADAIAAKNAEHPPGLSLYRDTAQSLRAAIKQVDAIDVQH